MLLRQAGHAGLGARRRRVASSCCRRLTMCCSADAALCCALLCLQARGLVIDKKRGNMLKVCAVRAVPGVHAVCMPCPLKRAWLHARPAINAPHPSLYCTPSALPSLPLATLQLHHADRPPQVRQAGPPRLRAAHPRAAHGGVQQRRCGAVGGGAGVVPLWGAGGQRRLSPPWQPP